jgi:ATP-binding cassette subfamily B protein
MSGLLNGATFALDAPKHIPPVWGADQEVLWSAGEPLMICGPQGVGKSTLTQRLILARLGIGDDVLALPNGLDTEVRQRGSNLSAGQRQLLSLARCALADPAVLVLDEATSSLDLGTERVVEQAFERLMAGRTVIVIAHRLSTAARADRVAVVDHGRIIEHGAHDELVARGGAYARLFAAWEGAAARPDSGSGPRGRVPELS